ncbi:MAG: PepSY-like domain-containing protein [Bacteroidetes bacterium]|nr:PepSY-like domain-containing protein [Bacteroidota bacterium]
MKTIIITAAALVFSINTACAQKVKAAEVPKAVIDSFNKNFSGTKVETWEKEKDGAYEAEFDLNKVETSATFSADGKLLETETEIAVSALPKAVTDYLAKNYAGKKIKEAAKIVDGNGKIKYEAEVDKKDLLFDEQGNFIK